MKIFGVGMNYILHNKELDGALYKPEEPVIFTKADSSVLHSGKPFFVPDWCEQTDYEGELVVRICKLGKTIAPRFAHRYWDAVTVGIDFTARDVQRKARREGLPWTICKGFDGSACVGEWIAKDELDTTWADTRLRLDLNGTTVQTATAGEMLFSIDELIAYVSRFFTLRTGDLLFTGTPQGVGPVSPGDKLEGWLNDRQVLTCHCK